ncbi:unnamed protein product [Acanthocheilonema viteae]|uniref:Uncharacterized protein n=1 Tax=Acanthocheilonema viteae TaxID=6277 RepID=A0A498S2R9_ACAVI|nr:unnamed protein product [Acanthocheilonema viteae]
MRRVGRDQDFCVVARYRLPTTFNHSTKSYLKSLCPLLIADCSLMQLRPQIALMVGFTSVLMDAVEMGGKKEKELITTLFLLQHHLKKLARLPPHVHWFLIYVCHPLRT